MKEQLIQRWDGFLQKIELRFNESLKHAEQACVEQLEDTDYDYNTVFRSWQGMKAQISDLIQKIDETWHAKVEPEMRAAGDFWTTESYKASACNDRLTDNLMRFERQLEGRLSEMFYNHAIQLANKNFKCSQCHSPIKIAQGVFRVHYVDCQYCQATNTFTPDAKYQQLGWNIVDNIAAKRCESAYQTMQKSLEAIQNQRPPVADEYWEKYKRAYFQYYEAFFTERMKLNADKKSRFEDDMARKEKEYNNYEKTYRKTFKN